MAKLRIVPDSNVLISGLLWCGPPNNLLKLAEGGPLLLISTSSILSEVEEALARSKFAPRILQMDSSVRELMGALLGSLAVIAAPRIRRVIKEDPDDDKILACALAASAEWIVTGDHHILSLGSYRGIKFATPAQFLSSWAPQAR